MPKIDWYFVSVIVGLVIFCAIAFYGYIHDMNECLADGHKHYECVSMQRHCR